MPSPDIQAGEEFWSGAEPEEADPQELPSFRGPPPRLPAKPLSRPPASHAVQSKTVASLAPSARAPQRRWPALRAFVLLAALSAVAVVMSPHVAPKSWTAANLPDVFLLLRGAPRSAPAKAQMLEEKLRHPSAARESSRAEGSALEPLRVVSKDLAALALHRGDELMEGGDVTSARRFYELAATAGIPGAELALAQTYDPAYLRRLGAIGVQGDAVMAARLYREAASQRGEQ